MSKQTENKNSDLVDVGAFWKKNKNGKNFLSGKVKIANKEFTAFIFSNNKNKPNQPDYRLVLSNMDDELKPAIIGADKPTQEVSEQEVSNQDDIPF